jgi:uncharacterized protein (TIGR02996 family)
MKKLLAAVLDAPEDDDARLVYADYLLEQGDPRGEFIQIQIRLGGSAWGARGRRSSNVLELTNEELIAREKSLLKRHQKAWLEPFRTAIRTWIWKRGFVFSVEADGAKLLDGIETVLEHAPLERAVLTALKPPLLAKLAKTRAIERLRDLRIAQNRIGPKTADVLHSPHFKNLRSLDLWGNPLGEEGGKMLGTAPHLGSLKVLDLSTCELTPGAVDAISKAKYFPQLENLNLRFNDALGPEIGESLSRARALRVLDINRCHLGDAGLERLLESKALMNLEDLSFFGNDITMRGVKALVESRSVPKLKTVYGGFNSKSDELKLLNARFPEKDD